MSGLWPSSSSNGNGNDKGNGNGNGNDNSSSNGNSNSNGTSGNKGNSNGTSGGNGNGNRRRYVSRQASAISDITTHSPQSPWGVSRVGSCRFIHDRPFSCQYVIQQLSQRSRPQLPCELLLLRQPLHTYRHSHRMALCFSVRCHGLSGSVV